MAADSTTMTVEFLRARLLSERSLSRTVRQRADQLAKRVADLEDQLRIVTDQRKKAEKAAIEVLSILEAQGLSGDFSEVVDSSSDQEEIPCQQEGAHDHHTVKEDDSSNTSRLDTSEVDDAFSESESQLSPTQGRTRSRSLSWKGGNRPTPLVTNGNIKIDHNRQRQRRNFMYAADSSPRHPLGKSCRKIKRKEMGCAVENGKNSPDEFQDLGVKEHDAEDDFSDNKDKIDDQTKHDDNIKSTQNGIDKDEEMEQALEKQARLILQYQAEEDSQREWEDKFKENNVSTTDATRLPDGIMSDEKELNSVNEPIADGLLDVVNEASHGSPAKNTGDCAAAPYESVSCSANDLDNNTVRLMDQTQRVDGEGSVKLESGSQEFEFPGQDILCRRVEHQEIMGDKCDVGSSGSSNLKLPIHFSVDSPSYESLSSGQSNLIFSSGRNTNSGSRLGHVLDSLHSAKLSLMKQLNRSTTQNHNHISGVRSSDILDIPTSSAHLFRLPTDGAPRSDLSYYNATSSTLPLSYPSDAVGSNNSNQRTADTERSYGMVMPVYNRMYSYPSSPKLSLGRNGNDGLKNNDMDLTTRRPLGFRRSNDFQTLRESALDADDHHRSNSEETFF